MTVVICAHQLNKVTIEYHRSFQDIMKINCWNLANYFNRLKVTNCLGFYISTI